MKSKNKKLVLVIIAVVILATLGFFIFKSLDRSSDDLQEETATINEINYDPPTNEEKEAGEKKKDAIVKNQTDQEPKPNAPDEVNKKSVKPIITSAGHFEEQIEVRSFIPGIYESSGTCTVVFTKDTNKTERKVEGIQDATTTRCDTVMILREDFPSSGTWTVKVNYSSPSSQGESDVTSFEVQ